MSWVIAFFSVLRDELFPRPVPAVVRDIDKLADLFERVAK